MRLFESFVIWIVATMLSLLCGCMVDASKLAGYSNPSAEISYSPLWGFRARTGADFTGDFEGHYNPETGAIDVVATVGVNASQVVGAEGERADHLVKLREIETAYLLESQKTVGDNFQAFGQLLAIATAAGGDAARQVIEAGIPILQGSRVRVDIPGVGGAEANLGESSNE